MEAGFANFSVFTGDANIFWVCGTTIVVAVVVGMLVVVGRVGIVLGRGYCPGSRVMRVEPKRLRTRQLPQQLIDVQGAQQAQTRLAGTNHKIPSGVARPLNHPLIKHHHPEPKRHRRRRHVPLQRPHLTHPAHPPRPASLTKTHPLPRQLHQRNRRHALLQKPVPAVRGRRRVLHLCVQLAGGEGETHGVDLGGGGQGPREAGLEGEVVHRAED